MTIFGKCSVCQALHPAPFGSRCRYAADARQYCLQNGLPEKDFLQHIDFERMPKPSSDDVIEQDPQDSAGALSGITPAMMADLKISMDKGNETHENMPPPYFDEGPQSYGYDQPGAAGGTPMATAPFSPPITAQPQHTTVVIQQQPAIIQVERGRMWSSGICDCCSDCESCCCVLFCMPCYLCSISGMMGEGQCMPCCVPTVSAVAMLRLKLRMREKIEGTIKDDYCTACCCTLCAVCQLKRELNASRTRLDAFSQLHG